MIKIIIRNTQFTAEKLWNVKFVAIKILYKIYGPTCFILQFFTKILTPDNSKYVVIFLQFYYTTLTL